MPSADYESLRGLMTETLKHENIPHGKNMPGCDQVMCFVREIDRLKKTIKKIKDEKSILKRQLHELKTTAAVLRLARRLNKQQERR